MKILLIILAITASVSIAEAASNLGGGALGFSCNVNTQKCECEGIETGADCQAMKKNCGSNALSCFKNLQYKDICICNMAARKTKVPRTVRPKLNEIAPE